MAWALGISSMVYVFYFFVQRREADMGLLLCSASMISFLSSVLAAVIGMQGHSSMLIYVLIFLGNSIVSGVLVLYFSSRAVGLNNSVFSKQVDAGYVLLISVIGMGIALIFSRLLANDISYCSSERCLSRLKLMAMDYDTLMLYAFSFFPVFLIQGVLARAFASLTQTKSPW